MKNIIILLILSVAALIGCSSNGNEKEITRMIDGTYINQTHNAYKIIVQGNSWTSTIDGDNYGKGTYTLSGSGNVSGRSTHAWNSGIWVPYTDDTFTGTYDEGKKSFTITSTGHDTNFNGTYARQ
jgi:dTDP-glucose pyrophosphorylase